MEWTDPVVLELCRRHGGADPEPVIRELCPDLVAVCPRESGPTPLRMLASFRNVRDIGEAPSAAATGCSGYIVRENGGYVITLDDREPRGRRVISLGHEVTHTYFLEVGRRAAATLEEEHLCDVGGTELVMPEVRFTAFLRQVGVSMAGIELCRKEFEGSFEATARRVMELTDTPACFLIARVRRTRDEERRGAGEPRLRVDHWTASRSWPDRSCYKGVAFAPSSLVAEVFTQQDERAELARLGTNFHDGLYHIEATGYSYVKGADGAHRQVAVLLTLPEGHGTRGNVA